jgi:uncharacterized protein YjbI with pentapeptide repeats
MSFRLGRKRPAYRTKINRAQIETILLEAVRERRPPDLTLRDFAELDLSGINFTTTYRPTKPGQYNAWYTASDFRWSKLIGCCFSGADVSNANMRGADLTGAKMVGTNLYNTLFARANLSQADLRRSNLYSAELHDVSLEGANVAGAHFGETSILDVDMSRIWGLDKAVHVAASPIGSDTLRLTASGLNAQSAGRRSQVLAFFRNSGLDEDLLQIVREWIAKPTEYYSVFISHSSRDNDFALKLYQDLRSKGINCWYDEKEILPGDYTMGRVDGAIKRWDKMVLVCSINSLSTDSGWWVEQEIERALQKEREFRKKRNRIVPVLIPITIDGYVFERWSSPYKTTVTQRHIGDFRDWRDERAYGKAISKLIDAIDRSRIL